MLCGNIENIVIEKSSRQGVFFVIVTSSVMQNASVYKNLVHGLHYDLDICRRERLILKMENTTGCLRFVFDGSFTRRYLILLSGC